MKRCLSIAVILSLLFQSLPVESGDKAAGVPLDTGFTAQAIPAHSLWSPLSHTVFVLWLLAAGGAFPWHAYAWQGNKATKTTGVKTKPAPRQEIKGPTPLDTLNKQIETVDQKRMAFTETRDTLFARFREKLKDVNGDLDNKDWQGTYRRFFDVLSLSYLDSTSDIQWPAEWLPLVKAHNELKTALGDLATAESGAAVDATKLSAKSKTYAKDKKPFDDAAGTAKTSREAAETALAGQRTPIGEKSPAAILKTRLSVFSGTLNKNGEINVDVYLVYVLQDPKTGKFVPVAEKTSKALNLLAMTGKSETHSPSSLSLEAAQRGDSPLQVIGDPQASLETTNAFLAPPFDLEKKLFPPPTPAPTASPATTSSSGGSTVLDTLMQMGEQEQQEWMAWYGAADIKALAEILTREDQVLKIPPPGSVLEESIRLQVRHRLLDLYSALTGVNAKDPVADLRQLVRQDAARLAQELLGTPGNDPLTLGTKLDGLLKDKENLLKGMSVETGESKLEKARRIIRDGLEKPPVALQPIPPPPAAAKPPVESPKTPPAPAPPKPPARAPRAKAPVPPAPRAFATRGDAPETVKGNEPVPPSDEENEHQYFLELSKQYMEAKRNNSANAGELFGKLRTVSLAVQTGSGQETLQKWAKETGIDLAAEFGIGASNNRARTVQPPAPTPVASWEDRMKEEVEKVNGDARLQELRHHPGVPEKFQNALFWAIMRSAGDEVGYKTLKNLLAEGLQGTNANKMQELLELRGNPVMLGKERVLFPDSGPDASVDVSLSGKTLTVRIYIADPATDSVKFEGYTSILEPQGDLSKKRTMKSKTYDHEHSASHVFSKYYDKAFLIPFVMPFVTLFDTILELFISAFLFLFPAMSLWRQRLAGFHTHRNVFWLNLPDRAS